MNYYKTQDILDKAEHCIKNKKPFNIIRFGDGGIKFIHAILHCDYKQLNIIIKKEGLPRKELIKIFELWGYYARHADCIDTPEVYFNQTFWPRIKKPGKRISDKTLEKMNMWKELYYSSEFDNDNYCNPEVNYLMLLDIPGRKNLFDLMKNRKVAIITAKPRIKYVLSSYNTDIIQIVGQYENQYQRSFHKVVKTIEEKANQYDLWLVAAGELGRIYTGMIKQYGGRALDIGFVVEFWLGQSLHPRLLYYMVRSSKNQFTTRLTKEGKRFIDGI